MQSIKFDSILYVEDEELLLNTVKKTLTYFTSNLYTALNGKEALELFNNHKPQLIISDINMPIMDGIKFCTEVKKINPKQHFIFLTAFNNNDLLHQAIKLQVSGFLTKPLNPHDLKSLLKDTYDMIQLENVLEQKKELQIQYDNLSNVIDTIDDTIRVIDKDYNIIMMNEASKKLIQEEFISDFNHPKCYEVSHHTNTPCDSRNHYCPLSDVIKTGEMSKVIHNHIKNGKTSIEQVSISPLKNKAGEIYAYIEHCNDVTELLETKEKLHYEQKFDSHTNLPNRNHLLEILDEKINESSHHKSSLALIFVDISNLKLVNESLGHIIGDQVILEFSKWIQEIVRKEDTVARISGDGFAILMGNIEDTLAPVRVINKLDTKTSSSNLEIMFNEIKLTFNAGITIYPHDGTTSQAMLKNTESALNKAKELIDSNFKFYTEDLTKKAIDKLIIESNLKKAIDNDQFELYFQPQYNSKTNSLIGMEALIRWQNSTLGFVSPEKFIPYLEDSGSILKVGNWIIESVCHTISRWKEKNYNFGRVSINVSLNQLKQGDVFIHKLNDLIEKTNCNHDDIGIEITESTLMENYDETIVI